MGRTRASARHVPQALPAACTVPQVSTGEAYYPRSRVRLTHKHRRSCRTTFAQVNTGEGTAYHFARSECSPPKLKRSLSLVLDEVPVRRLTDSSFWRVQ